MIRLRKIGVIYKDIALYLSNKGYKSSRGKQLTGKLVERMIAKRKISEERGSVQKVEYGDISIVFMKEWREEFRVAAFVGFIIIVKYIY